MRIQEAIDHILARLDREIKPDLYYHGPHHTRDVMDALELVAAAEGVKGEDLDLLRVAAAYHDCGFLEDHREHEMIGCRIARAVLPSMDFTEDQIRVIEGMIMATKVPQQPKTRLEEIICDADLDYLGRNDVAPIASSLFDELKSQGVVKNEQSWNQLQVKFLSGHHYHTDYARSTRAPIKSEYLKQIEHLVNNYRK